MALVDLRDEIERHCEKCEWKGTIPCDLCFFASVDLGRIDLGHIRTYRRAFHYLRSLRESGFVRDDTFGTKLNITRKVTMK